MTDITEAVGVTGGSNEPPPGDPPGHRKPNPALAWLDRHKGTVVAAAIAAVALTLLGLLLGGNQPAKQTATVGGASVAPVPSVATVTEQPTIPAPGATTVTAPAPGAAPPIAPAAFTQPAVTTTVTKAAAAAPAKAASAAPAVTVTAPTVPAPVTVTATPAPTVTVTAQPTPTVTVTVTFTPIQTATPPPPVATPPSK